MGVRIGDSLFKFNLIDLSPARLLPPFLIIFNPVIAPKSIEFSPKGTFIVAQSQLRGHIDPYVENDTRKKASYY